MSPAVTFKEVLKFGNCYAGKVLKEIKSATAKDDNDFLVKTVCLFFFAKAYKSFQVFQLLWEKGFTEDAQIIARTIFEIMLQTKYISEEPLKLSTLFIDFDGFARYRWFEKISKLNSSIKVPQNLKSEYDRVKANYEKSKNKNHWWGESIKWLAKETDCEEWYVSLYRQQSELVHSGVFSINEYIEEGKTGLNVICGPSRSDDISIPRDATLFFVTVASSTALSFGVKGSITEIDKEEWGRLFGVDILKFKG